MQRTFKNVRWSHRLARLILKSIGTLNSRKLGRQYRGSCLLIASPAGFSRNSHNELRGTISLEWRVIPGSKGGLYRLVDLATGKRLGRMQVYDYADHGKLIKAIKELQ